ncbi:DUF2828 family protein [Clostridium nigeriense]|uniref:DUF2828 family protein n=1 Tax=Clostridium nigeriense TaxID=1805470 RepID=UPI003D3585CF
MSKALKKIREELYKISNIDIDITCIDYIFEFLNDIDYLRVASEERIILSFKPIFYSDKLLGIKFLFFIRDIRGGLGERRIFRVLLRFLGENETDILMNNLHLISLYGRWDDYYSLFETPLESNVINIFKKQLQKDINTEYPSTLAKWLKSENTSSKRTKALATKTKLLLGYSSKEYRILLTDLRKKSNLVENNIRTSNYRDINYDNISPSVLMKYKKAFLRNDKENFLKIKNNLFIENKLFLENIDNIFFNKNIKNISNINLINYFPNTINNNIIINSNNIENNRMILNLCNNEILKIIENIENLEDTFIINGIEKGEINKNYKEIKVLIKAMLLYKKINFNAFKDYYLYYNKTPKFKKIDEENLFSHLCNLFFYYTNDNINFNNGMDLILFTLIKKNFEKSFSPKSILFIYNNENDLKFDNIDEINEKWIKAGYEMPKIKLWNLNNFNENFYIKKHDKFIIINGYSKNIWSFLLGCKEINRTKFLINKFDKSKYEINMI